MTVSMRWAIVTMALVGAAVGLGAFTFVYAKGYSYLTNDPAACANCHVMREHYAAWAKASHRSVAGCNDCHTPHALVPKYVTKAKNGFWHSFYFTTGRFPEPIGINAGNLRITEHACRECHREITSAIDHGEAAERSAPAGRDSTRADAPSGCIRCHPYVGHWVR